MRFERTAVSNEMMLNALYGMRNPMNSWAKSDSKITNEGVEIGENDKKLALTLIKSGSDHSKFLRQIPVSVQITAPEFWWPEMDQYKVGTATNSTSKMHKLLSTKITPLCFEEPISPAILSELERYQNWAIQCREMGTADCNNKEFQRLLNALPLGWLQTRMWSANYAVLRNIYFARKNHKLPQWRKFCAWVESLPNSFLITTNNKE